MEMTLNMGAFGALDQQELFAVDGGAKLLDVGMGVAGVYSAGVGVVGFLGTTSLACAGTCAAIAAAPVVACTAAICGVASAAYGIYCIFK